MYESNIILFVGTKENTNFPENQIIVWDEIKKRKIGVLMMKESVIDLKVSKCAIFAVLRNKVFYSFNPDRCVWDFEFEIPVYYF